jgi:hypothetical protein
MACLIELNLSVNQSEQCPIAACANIQSGHELGAALANQNAACGDKFSAIPFNPEPFANAVAAVANTALTFLMCHKSFLLDAIELAPFKILKV